MRKDNHEIDDEAARAALDIHILEKQGERITMVAAAQASDQMAKLTGKLNTKGRKIEALRAHALYMGIGSAFMKEIAPLMKVMAQELIDEHKKKGLEFSKDEADILADLWLAKIFMQIDKGIDEYEAS